MRHRSSSKHFSRDTKARQAMLKGLVRSVVESGYIVTTKAKAKEAKKLVDKLVYKAKTDTVANRRQLHTFFGKRDVVNTLVERVAPAFKRDSGFTSIKSVGVRRGDNVEMVKLSLVEEFDRVGSFKSGQDHSKAKKSKPASKKETKPAKKAAKPATKKTKVAPKAKTTSKSKKK